MVGNDAHIVPHVANSFFYNPLIFINKINVYNGKLPFLNNSAWTDQGQIYKKSEIF